jgi:hypothetical protein
MYCVRYPLLWVIVDIARCISVSTLNKRFRPSFCFALRTVRCIICTSPLIRCRGAKESTTICLSACQPADPIIHLNISSATTRYTVRRLVYCFQGSQANSHGQRTSATAENGRSINQDPQASSAWHESAPRRRVSGTSSPTQERYGNESDIWPW